MAGVKDVLNCLWVCDPQALLLCDKISAKIHRAKLRRKGRLQVTHSNELRLRILPKASFLQLPLLHFATTMHALSQKALIDVV